MQPEVDRNLHWRRRWQKATECSGSSDVPSGCKDWHVESYFSQDLVSVSGRVTSAIITVVLQWQPHLPSLSLQPALSPDLRLSSALLALGSVLAYPGCVHLLAFFLASRSSLWGIKIAPHLFYFFNMQIQSIQAYF